MNQTHRGKKPGTQRREHAMTQPSPEAADGHESGPSFVVGIGGSAGGLEAFSSFFEAMPPDTGMAFVVIQHMDPDRKGVIAQLLQKHTPMPVTQATDGLRTQPNQVYVIPPNCDLSILRGTLHLMEMIEPRGQRLPVDYFFRQLAADAGDRAIGVIMSGMGTDGTQGMRSLKEHFGLVVVQDPQSAKYDSMPRSAIATDLVDFVAPPPELAARIADYSRRSVHLPIPEHPAIVTGGDPLQKVFVLLRNRTGHDFTLYKRNTIDRRLARRMGIHRIDDLAHYVRYLQENNAELDLLSKELLIGVTQFFRDPEAFTALKERLLSRLTANGPEGSPFRAWVAGCSTGEEAYSVAITVQECQAALPAGADMNCQIFATDLDKVAIENARRGLFPPNILADLSEERLQRFFRREGDNYGVRKNIRDKIVFAPQDVIMHPPFTKLDLICCRNLLIYLVPELQQRLLSMFHYALNPGGLLFLGSAETIGARADLFATLDSKWRIYERRATSSARRSLPEMPVVPAIRASERSYPNSVLLREKEMAPDPVGRLLAELYAPPSVVVTPQGDVVFVHGRTGKYLELPAGKTNMNLYAMAREGLRLELNRAVRQAAVQPEEIRVELADFEVDGHPQPVTIIVRRIDQLQTMQGLVLITFEDPSSLVGAATATRRRRRRLKGKDSEAETSLKKELEQTSDLLQSTMEQMASVQEELTSTNEEMQSANEELQSTNEELATTNAELESKVSELSVAHDDLTNLMNSAEIATIFVDGGFHIKRFTAEVTHLVNLIPADVGRPLSHVMTNLVNCDLDERAREVVRTLVHREEHVESKDGRWYLLRIHPYRTRNDVIAGAVLTFTDITTIKQLERSLRDSEQGAQEAMTYAENIVATVREPLLILDSTFRVVSANRSYYQFFRAAPEETEGRLLSEIGGGQWHNRLLEQQLETVLPGHTEITGFVLDFDSAPTGRRKLILNARRVRNKHLSQDLILLAMEAKDENGAS
ncbi:MAG TPA: chemotaxis protein CheB [bacterium]|jgi:two-component system CheB/CheR fusion protein